MAPPRLPRLYERYGTSFGFGSEVIVACGQALISGGYQGARPLLAFRPSDLTTIASRASIDADARTDGDGGLDGWLLDPANFLIRYRDNNPDNLTVIGNSDNGKYFIISEDGETVLIDSEEFENTLTNERSVKITKDPAPRS